MARHRLLVRPRPERIRQAAMLLAALPFLALPIWLLPRFLYIAPDWAIVQYSAIGLQSVPILIAVVLIATSMPRQHQPNKAPLLLLCTLPLVGQFTALANVVAPERNDTHTQVALIAITLEYLAMTVLSIFARRFLRHINFASVGIKRMARAGLGVSAAACLLFAATAGTNALLVRVSMSAPPPSIHTLFRALQILFTPIFWGCLALHFCCWACIWLAQWKLIIPARR